MGDFVHSISHWPKASTPDAVQHCWDRLIATNPELASQAVALMPAVAAIAGNSPFLSDLILRHSALFQDLCHNGPETVFARVMDTLFRESAQLTSKAEMQKCLRVAKQQVALVTAFADISQHWEVMTVTDHLTAFADAALDIASRYILGQAARTGEIEVPDVDDPVAGSGLLILAMGKHGAHELNYSSDIDLIILFDTERATYQGRKSVQHFYNYVAQQLLSLLDERTADGYVFRLDLRLRPDPRSTPLAVNMYSAISYYESVGQNWERAAMIKSRPVVADLVSLETWRAHIRPYIWRAHLDYAAVQDIQSIRRQISMKVGETLEPAGFDIKLGTGGIREIELFVQSHQLIWGGRHPELRLRGTLRCLEALVEEELVSAEDAHMLQEAYLFYRMVEHRLQMVRDQQTHSLPESEEERRKIAIFCGFDGLKAFESQLVAWLTNVHAIYVKGLSPDSSLAVPGGGNLVFTGVDADPQTLKTLTSLGFQSPQTVSDAVQEWHRGTRRATRTLRARQLLTELVPLLLYTIGATPYPDETFKRFDQFIAKLPVGVQLFSLFTNQPDVMRLVITLLGVAPDLSETLSKHPALLDGVMSDDFYESLPERALLDVWLDERLLAIHDQEDDELWLRQLRQFKQERAFQAGVQLITGKCDIARCNAFLSDLADCLIQHVLRGLLQRYARKHGRFPDMQLGVIAMGRLGSQELTFHSDVDIMLVYQMNAEAKYSDGDKALDVGNYFQRFASRFFNALTMLTREGQLYDVDNRLRPHGVKGPLAIRLEAFDAYYREEAWVVETAGLCKGRVIAALEDAFIPELQTHVMQACSAKSSPEIVAAALAEVRDKMRGQHANDNVWDVKHVKGGLIDLDFLAHYLQLAYGDTYPDIRNRQSMQVFNAAQWVNLINENDCQTLMQSYRMQRDVLSILRLCAQDVSKGLPNLPGLREFMVTHFETEDAAELAPRLEALQQASYAIFERLILQDATHSLTS